VNPTFSAIYQGIVFNHIFYRRHALLDQCWDFIGPSIGSPWTNAAALVQGCSQNAISIRRRAAALAYQKYMYEDLGEQQFEQLVVLIGQELFGPALQGFATGPDGGRDAKFVGTACAFPNASFPWTGTTILQAKHCNGHNQSFSENDFFNPTTGNCVISKEISRIKKLVNKGKTDNYMLIANRKLSAGAEDNIRVHIASECGLETENVYLCGIEQLEVWMKKYPDIPRQADLDPVDAPLIVSPDNLADVVEAFASRKDDIVDASKKAPKPRISFEEKNDLNNMTPEFAKELRSRYLKETATISHFLALPENEEVRETYEDVVEEFNLKVVAKRRDYQTFDDVYNYILDMLFRRDPVLRKWGNKRITRAILFYMYWHCDLGAREDA